MTKLLVGTTIRQKTIMTSTIMICGMDDDGDGDDDDNNNNVTIATTGQCKTEK
jgi:hypothetical protein